MLKNVKIVPHRRSGQIKGFNWLLYVIQVVCYFPFPPQMTLDWSKYYTDPPYGNKQNKYINDQDLNTQGQFTKFITTNDVEQINLQTYSLTELVFPTQTIMKIDIQISPSYIYFKSADEMGWPPPENLAIYLLSLPMGTSDDITNLSMLENLTDVRLMGIKRNIKFPCQLDSLVISQDVPHQFKILNDEISCEDISVTNFDISEVRFDDCENLSLVNVIGSNNVLDISYLHDLQNIKLKNIQQNIILPDQFDKLELTLPENSQYQIINRQLYCDEITITNYNLTNIEFESCSSISLTDCVADRLSLTNLADDDLQIKFTRCAFKILDYFESNCMMVDDSQFINSKVEKIILPNMLENLFWSKCIVNELVFITFDNIESINIQLFPRVIYSTYSNADSILDVFQFINLDDSNMIIDLSRFISLEEVILHGIKNNILLPDKLNKLELVQAEQFKYEILNNSISCNNIIIENFKFSKIKLLDCESLELWNCNINQLFLENENMNIKIRNSRIGLCRFQQEIDINSFSSKNFCKFVSYNNQKNSLIYNRRTKKSVKTLNKSIILAIKMNAIFRKTNELLNE